MNFIEALKHGNLDKLKDHQKSDTHNHATRGGCYQDVISFTPDFSERFNDLNEMQEWYNNNIKSECVGKEGFEKRVIAAFKQAERDNISPLVLSLGLGDKIHYKNDLELFVNAIKRMSIQHYHGQFVPEISISRGMNPKVVLEELNEVIKFNFFKSIDLTGDESLGVDHFKEVFEFARSKHLTLRAHVGEFSDEGEVLHVCKTLRLDEINHGNSAVNSKTVMSYLRDNDLILNLCPSSNIRLKRVDKLRGHPIRTLHRNNVRTTINTDDMLIFNSSVSEEYLKLYQAKCLTAEELDDIRLGQNSLKIISYDGSQDVIDFYQRMVKFSFEQNNIEDTDACMEEIEDKANKLSDFEKGNGLLLLCYLKERLIATISYAKPNELLLELSDKDLSDYHELGTVFIDPEYQGFGFLSYLIEQLKNKLEAAGIKKICFDCGYDLAQQVWTHKYGKADDIFADYWSKDSHHMIWYTTIDQL